MGEWYQNDEYAQCKAVAAHFEGAMGMMQEMKCTLFRFVFRSIETMLLPQQRTEPSAMSISVTVQVMDV